MQEYLVQTLIRCSKNNRILLGRWNRGPFQGRISGLLGQAVTDKGPEEAAKIVVKSLIDLDVDTSTSVKT